MTQRGGKRSPKKSALRRIRTRIRSAGHSGLTRPGSSPGIEQHADRHADSEPESVSIEISDWNEQRIETQSVESLQALAAATRPDWATVRWINVIGLHAGVLQRFGKLYGLNSLALEDALNVPQRPKVERFGEQLLVVLRALSQVDDELQEEQISLFQQPGLVISFQERSGDPFGGVRERLQQHPSRLRQRRSGYLVYALIDAIVDMGFPVLEHYDERLEELDLAISDVAEQQQLNQLHTIRRDLVLIRRSLWPTREVTDDLYREGLLELDDSDSSYLRDVYDHTLQLIDLAEAMRETTASLMDLYLSMLSNKLNEVMRVLTVIATLFIPITFLAGVYGMNFEHIPELQWRWAYPAFWVVVVTTLAGLLWWFRRNRWL